MSKLTILHTNDMHNQLSEEAATRLRQIREEQQTNSLCLLLDAGDAIKAGNLTFNPAGEPILERMSELGYNAMCIGNREFHFSEIGFHAKLSKAHFPVLCANVRPRGEVKLPVRPWWTLNYDGLTIGIFGVTVPMITQRMLSQHVSAYVFDDPIRKGCEIAEELRPQVDLLIALTHIGFKQDIVLAQSSQAIDIIIGGHTHTVLEQPHREGKTAIVQAGSYARFLGQIELEMDNPLRVTARLLPLRVGAS